MLNEAKNENESIFVVNAKLDCATLKLVKTVLKYTNILLRLKLCFQRDMFQVVLLVTLFKM